MDERECGENKFIFMGMCVCVANESYEKISKKTKKWCLFPTCLLYCFVLFSCNCRVVEQIEREIELRVEIESERNVFTMECCVCK